MDVRLHLTRSSKTSYENDMSDYRKWEMGAGT
jgi:hypothetical protein